MSVQPGGYSPLPSCPLCHKTSVQDYRLPSVRATVTGPLGTPVRGCRGPPRGRRGGGLQLLPADLSLYERTVSATRSQLGDAAFEEAQAEGRAMTFEQAVAYALEDHDAPPN